MGFLLRNGLQGAFCLLMTGALVWLAIILGTMARAGA